MPRSLFQLILVCLFLLPLARPAAGAADPAEFERILNLSMAALTAEAEDRLGKTYPEEDWEKWDFPKYVFISTSVETAYRIAVKHPELLRQVPCYCACDAMGHSDLLHCFLKEGRVGGGYDEHAVGCPICYGQAMLAFLWQQAGADEEQIRQGMETKFAPR